MSSSIPLTSGIKSSLLSLQKTQKLYDQTQENLTTGLKVNKPSDDPAAYYAAATLNDRASALEGRLDNMGQAVQAIAAADNGISAITSILENMKAIVENALSTDVDDDSTRAALGKKFNDLVVQLNGFAGDSAYGGVNLLDNDQSIKVQMGQSYNESVFTVQGFHIAGVESTGTDSEVTAIGSDSVPDSWGAGAAEVTNYSFALNKVEDPTTVIGIKSFGTDATGAAGHEIDWKDSDTYKDTLSDVLDQIENVTAVLETRSKLFSFDSSTISLRQDYTQEFINTLEEGADNLTLADLNEESANLLALQTSQSLGVQAMSLSNQQTQNVLRLLQ
ncbi:MAG: flagellin [Opitutales bacterium]|nr:flagellin [Opitutales bacterium]